MVALCIKLLSYNKTAVGIDRFMRRRNRIWFSSKKRDRETEKTGETKECIHDSTVLPTSDLLTPFFVSAT